MTIPTFSVIIPAYNVADYIGACLDSLLGQDFTDYEAIVIDDGSTDGTARILRAIAQKNPQIKLIRQPNAGLSAARNAGVAHASGEYLLFLDGDDFFAPGTLRGLAAAIQANSHPDVIRFQIQDFHEDGHLTPHHEAGFAMTTSIKAWPHLSTYHYIDNAWAYIYRADFFRQHGFRYAEGRLAEDFGLTPLIIARANNIVALDAIYYNYRQRAGSIMHDERKLHRRVTDALAQLEHILPELATIEGSSPIAHYCVVSLLSLAAQLPYATFVKIYRRAKQAGLFRYIRPASLKSLPRALAAKFSPRLFYRLYHH